MAHSLRSCTTVTQVVVGLLRTVLGMRFLETPQAGKKKSWISENPSYARRGDPGINAHVRKVM